MEITYKGFVAKITFSPAANSFSGEVLNSKHLITFQLFDLSHAKKFVQDAIDRYLSCFSDSEETLESA